MKNLTTYISSRIGLDDELGPFYKSISFWAIVVLATATLYDLVSKLQLFIHTGNVPLWVLYGMALFALVVWYIFARTKITLWVVLNDEHPDVLRPISKALTVITGLGIISILFILTFGH